MPERGREDLQEERDRRERRDATLGARDAQHQEREEDEEDDRAHRRARLDPGRPRPGDPHAGRDRPDHRHEGREREGELAQGRRQIDGAEPEPHPRQARFQPTLDQPGGLAGTRAVGLGQLKRGLEEFISIAATIRSRVRPEGDP